jgi:hypothetical protein
MKAIDLILYGMAIVGMTITGPFIVPVAAVIFGIHMCHKKRKEVPL